MPLDKQSEGVQYSWWKRTAALNMHTYEDWRTWRVGFKHDPRKTQAEWRVRTLLRQNFDWSEWDYQPHIDRFYPDFAHYPSKLLLEIDGEYHSSPIQQRRDRARTEHLAALGWRMLRVKNVEVWKQEEKVLQAIREAVAA